MLTNTLVNFLYIDQKLIAYFSRWVFTVTIFWIFVFIIFHDELIDGLILIVRRVRIMTWDFNTVILGKWVIGLHMLISHMFGVFLFKKLNFLSAHNLNSLIWKILLSRSFRFSVDTSHWSILFLKFGKGYLILKKALESKNFHKERIYKTTFVNY